LNISDAIPNFARFSALGGSLPSRAGKSLYCYLKSIFRSRKKVLILKHHPDYQKVMATTSDIRNGLCIEFNGDIYTVVEFQHVKPGKGNAFVRTKIKSLTTGKVVDNTFQAGHKVNDVRVERRKYQYLYQDEVGYNFMDNETFDQVSIPEAMIENTKFLKESTEVEILFHAEKGTPLTVDLPANVVLQITYTEPGLKGDTATNTLKPATVETGAEVRVPLFINEGDLVKVDTRTGAYLERAKQ
jgi:elongation factor P